MEIKRYTLDRKPISSEVIQSRQDFSKVLSQKTGISSLLGKKLLYFGTIGLATVVTVFVVSFRSEENANSNTQENTRSVVDSREAPSTIPSSASSNKPEQKVEFASTATEKVEVPKSVVQEPKQEVAENKQEQSSAKSNQEKSAEPIAVKSEKMQMAENPIRIVNYTAIAPSLGGVEVGPIYSDDLRENPELTLSGMLINSFSMTFFGANGEVTYAIDGTKIPETILSELIRYNKGFEFTITEIKATNKFGNRVSLPSMRLILK